MKPDLPTVCGCEAYPAQAERVVQAGRHASAVARLRIVEIEREEIGKKIEETVEKDTVGWGLEVTGIRIQDVDMPEELKKMMSRQASAEREKRATITKAEGDRDAAINLAAAAKTMAESPGAMQLRTLQTIDGLGPTASNTVVIPLPMAIYELMDSASLFIKSKTLPGNDPKK